MDEQERKRHAAEAAKRWRQRNPEWVRERERNRVRDPEYMRQKNRESYERHKAERLAKMRIRYAARRAEDPTYGNGKAIKRQARIRESGPKLPHGAYARRYALRDGRCVYCGTPIAFRPPTFFDHRVPLSRTGAHKEDNLEPCCVTCNKRKGTKLMEELGWRFWWLVS